MATQLDRIENKLDRIEQRCNQIAQLQLSSLTGDQIMASKLEELQAAVAAENTVISGAIVLINGIGQRILDAVAAARAGDDAALTSLAADVTAKASELAAAVAAVPSGSEPTP